MNANESSPVDFKLTHYQGLRKLDISGAIRDVSDSQLIDCTLPQTTNVVTVAWLGDSHHLLVAGQVPHHSVCKNMASFKLYEMLLPEMKIVATYSQSQAKKKFWSSLGPELRSAYEYTSER